MFQEILDKNLNFIQGQKAFRKFDTELHQLISKLNNKKIVTLSGIRHSGKTKLIAELLRKTNTMETCFYFDSELDSLGAIKKYDDLMTLIELFIKIYGSPKIIVLKNTSNIEDIKKCISQIYSSKKYKLIIAGNNIHIDGVDNIELFPLAHDFKSKNYLYGGIPEVTVVPDGSYKNFMLSALKNDILLKDIIEPYNIKNITLYYNIISFIAHDARYRTIREIHRMLKDAGVEVSLLTLIEYINAALNTRLLHRVYKYDLKKSALIESKAIYYFGDSGIGRSFGLSQSAAKANALYLLLAAKGYAIEGGIHGRFEFDFRAVSHQNTCMIRLTQESDKNEVRKLARKLGKIPHRCAKYIIVNDKSQLGMRKFIEEGVIICEASELAEHLG